MSDKSVSEVSTRDHFYLCTIYYETRTYMVYNVMGFFGLRPDAHSCVCVCCGGRGGHARSPDAAADQTVCRTVSALHLAHYNVGIKLLSKYTRRQCGGRLTLNG
jgi:hypothetical protein